MQRVFFTLNFRERIFDPHILKSAPIRAGVYGQLPYVLVTDSTTWKVPDHFSPGKGRLFLVGGGGSGGNYQRKNFRQGVLRYTGESGAQTVVYLNEEFLSVAYGGEHGNSAFEHMDTELKPKNGGGLGGKLQIQPEDGSNYFDTKTVRVKDTILLQGGDGGKAGEKFANSPDYSGIGGGGGGGYIPFGDKNPEGWSLPSSLESTITQAGDKGEGFGAGGGGSATTSYVRNIGTSGGSYGELRSFYFNYQPGDVLKFEIGEGGKTLHINPMTHQNGANGFALLYLSDAPSFFPLELPAPNVENYRITPVDQSIKTLMEFGTVRQRRISMQNRLKLQCSWLLNEHEFHIFARWFYHDIQNGSTPFFIYLKNPYKNDAYEVVRFSQPYFAQLVSTNMWRVDAQIDFIQNQPPETYV